MALSTAERKKLKPSQFVFPKERKDPIQSKHQAEVALTVGMHGASPAEKAKIRSTVHSRYPGIGKSDKKDSPMGRVVRGALGGK